MKLIFCVALVLLGFVAIVKMAPSAPIGIAACFILVWGVIGVWSLFFTK